MKEFEKYKKSLEGYKEENTIYNVAEEDKKLDALHVKRTNVKVIDKNGNVIRDIANATQEEQVEDILKGREESSTSKKQQQDNIKLNKDNNKKYKGRKLNLKRVLAVLSAGALAMGGAYIKINNEKEAQVKEMIYQHNIDYTIDSDINLKGFANNAFVNNIINEEQQSSMLIADSVEGAIKEESKQFSEFCIACIEYNKLIDTKMTEQELSKLLSLEPIIKEYALSGKLKQVSIDVLNKKMEVAVDNGDYNSPKSVLNSMHMNKDSKTGEKIMYVSDKKYFLNDKDYSKLPETVFNLANDILDYPEEDEMNVNELKNNLRKYALMGEHLSRVTMSNYILDKDGLVKRVNNEDFSKQLNKSYDKDEKIR